MAKLSTAADVYGAAIPWLNCGYTPQQIQAAYGLSTRSSTTARALPSQSSTPTPRRPCLADSNRYAANHGLPKLTTGVNFSQIIPLGIYDVSPTESLRPLRLVGRAVARHGGGARQCAGRQHRLRGLTRLQRPRSTSPSSTRSTTMWPMSSPTAGAITASRSRRDPRPCTTRPPWPVPRRA